MLFHEQCSQLSRNSFSVALNREQGTVGLDYAAIEPMG